MRADELEYVIGVGATTVEVPAAHRERLVLDFHGIGPRPAWVEPNEAFYWCEDESRFHALLDTIEAASAGSGRKIELTFDDGNMSDATIGVPALVDRGLTASFFVCAGRIGSPGYLDQAALHEIRAAGMEIGSHGWGHVDWRTVNDATLTIEVDGACECIEQTIGERVEAVAIPFGSYDRRVLGRLGRFNTLYNSNGGVAGTRHRRMVPRESFTRNWDDRRIVELATQSETPWASIRRRGVEVYKALR